MNKGRTILRDIDSPLFIIFLQELQGRLNFVRLYYGRKYLNKMNIY